MSMVPYVHLIIVIQMICYVGGLPVHEPGESNGELDTDSESRAVLNRLAATLPQYELCAICTDAVEVINRFITNEKTFEDVVPYATSVCIDVLTKRGYRGKEMCPGIIQSYGPATWFIFDQLALDPVTVCKKLNFCLPDFLNTSTPTKHTDRLRTKVEWTNQSVGRHQHMGYRTDAGVLRILQISDIHVDQKYAIGAVTDCGLFLCCRSNINGTGSSGYYGSYKRCDLPVHTLDIVLSEIRKLNPPPDFIIYTGDSPPHDVWQESWVSQLSNGQLVVDMLSSKLGDFTIYPAIGNHESFPQSFYYQPGGNYQILNSKLTNWWSGLFNISADQRQNIESSAYYTTLVRSGLRLLSFNTDYGYTANFYFLLNDRVSAYTEQLLFVENVLQQARQMNEKVIIIGHVPPGDGGSSAIEYGDFYTSLAINYSDVICLQLFGHTHHDMFELVLDGTGEQTAHGTVFIAPSVTTYGQVNPGFRMYKLDSETFDLLDYDQYYLNLTSANAAGKTEIKILYSAKEEYGLADMSAKSWKSLSDRLQTDEELLGRYRRNYLTGSGLEGPCDQSCKHKTWCSTRSASVRAYLSCLHSLQNLVYATDTHIVY